MLCFWNWIKSVHAATAYLQNPAIIWKNRNAGLKMSFKDLFIIYSMNMPLLESHLFSLEAKKNKKKNKGANIFPVCSSNKDQFRPVERAFSFGCIYSFCDC